MDSVFVNEAKNERTEFDINLKYVTEQLEKDKDFQFSMEIEEWESQDINNTYRNSESSSLHRYDSMDSISDGDNFYRWGKV